MEENVRGGRDEMTLLDSNILYKQNSIQSPNSTEVLSISSKQDVHRNRSRLTSRIAVASSRKSDSVPLSILNQSYMMDGEKKSRSLIFRSFGQMVRKVVRHVSSASDNTPVVNRKNKDQRKIQNCAAFDFGQGQVELRGDVLGDSVFPGVVGIQNHGNTCFINAVIQCLSNTERLAGYFVTDRYRDDMQRSKKHGVGTLRRLGGSGKSGGEMTEQLAGLLKSLWSCRYEPEVSGEFKKVLGRYGAQYQGCAQHDAQEFLLWLLDKVHEDLNVASKKKYHPNKSSQGRSDDVLASEALANHVRSNNSFIYDRFQALYRSSLTCPNCMHQSNTFDPFLSVSLPIPHSVQQSVYVTVVYRAATPRQVRIGLQVSQGTTIYDLRQILASDTNIPEDQMIIAEIDNDKFRRTFNDTDSTSDIHDAENIYAIETSGPDRLNPGVEHDSLSAKRDDVSSTNEEVATLLESEPDVLIVAINVVMEDARKRRFTEPVVVQVSRQCSFADIQGALLQEISYRLRDGMCTVQSSKSQLFQLSVIDEVSGDAYMLPVGKYPLGSDLILRKLTKHPIGCGPPHLKLIAAWDRYTVTRLVANSIDSVEEHESVRQVKMTSQQPLQSTLDECFQVYTQKEQLGFEDAWLCPNCHQRQQGTMKSLSLWSLPDVLVVHLKRFKQDSQQRIKLNTLVTFPLSGLDMSRHMPTGRLANIQQQVGKSSTGGGQWLSALKGSAGGRKPPDPSDVCTYDLYAVCNHYGNIYGGHYTAFCKNPAMGVWYSFNDSRATTIAAEQEIVTRAAYLLFYEKRSSRIDSLADPHNWLHRVQPSIRTMAAAATCLPMTDNVNDCENQTTGGIDPLCKRDSGNITSDVSIKEEDHESKCLSYSSPPSTDERPTNVETNHESDETCPPSYTYACSYTDSLRQRYPTCDALNLLGDVMPIRSGCDNQTVTTSDSLLNAMWDNNDRSGVNPGVNLAADTSDFDHFSVVDCKRVTTDSKEFPVASFGCDTKDEDLLPRHTAHQMIGHCVGVNDTSWSVTGRCADKIITGRVTSSEGAEIISAK